MYLLSSVYIVSHLSSARLIGSSKRKSAHIMSDSEQALQEETKRGRNKNYTYDYFVSAMLLCNLTARRN